MWRGTDGRAARLARRMRLPVEVLGYLFWLGVDCLWVLTGSPAAIGQLVIGAAMAVVVVSRRRIGAEPAAAVAFGLSALATLVGAAGRALPVPWPASPAMSFCEQLALAVVTIAALRRAGDRRTWQLCVGSALVIIGSPLLRPDVGGTDAVFVPLSVMGWIGAAAIGLMLREGRSRRLAQLADARNAERMELARELHDVVAHHVTGIVVAAQAATVVARTRPAEVGRALESIEHAGTDALLAMRRMVGVLRGEADQGPRTPGADLAGIAEVVRRFDPDRCRVRLRTDPGIEHAVLPAGVAATGYRVVQEALTNVRRHAPEASSVEVELHVREEQLVVTVRNDGVGPDGPPLTGHGGFGLAGMAERVAALDGRLQAGPSAAGVWTVTARLPIGSGR